MFSPGIEKALRRAIEAHDGQVRKGYDAVPYITHPLHAAFMLARIGASEIAIQAALLHDIVEDVEDWTLERVELEFGADVRAIVADLTEDKDGSWQERKQAAIDNVVHMSAEAACVKAADKLHNLRTLADDLAARPPDEVWCHFRGGRERTIRMAADLIEALAPRVDGRLLDALQSTLARIRERAGD